MSNLKTWDRVPNGARLVMRFEVPAGRIVTVRVRCVDAKSKEVIFEDAVLQPGPTEMKLLSSAGHYSIRVGLVFADACAVTFHAEIMKPVTPPERHGKPFAFAVTGTAGAVKRATIVCTMQP